MRGTGSASLLFALVVSPGTSCGSRTELRMAEACAVEGEEQPCRDACGEGTRRCEDGFFGECVVARAERSCRNACGTGVEECVDGRWGECAVAYTERSCDNVCGLGVEGCTDGEWSECQVPIVQRDCQSVCGFGHETCSDGAWGACDAPQPRPPVLQATVRDFREAHPDFEIDIDPTQPGQPGPGGDGEIGLVEFELGPDDKPVYQSRTPRTRTTTGRANFDQWYRDRFEEGINYPAPLTLQLGPSPNVPGFFVYHNDDFFPIDDQLFGNEGHLHNFHFTLEARTTFEYLGGETFSFTGDDDMWVFINRRLAIDLGGLHIPRSRSVELDAIAATHGLVPGNIYTLHFFFAERHTIQSTFNIETSIADPGSCD